MKKVMPITLICFVFLIIITNFNLYKYYTEADSYDVSGTYIGYSSAENSYKFLQITTDQEGYVAEYDGCTYQLEIEYDSILGKEALFLVGEFYNCIKILLDCTELTGCVYMYDNENSDDYYDMVEINLFDIMLYDYEYYNENAKSVDSNIEINLKNASIQIVIDERYESQWIKLTQSNYSDGRLEIKDATITDNLNPDEQYYMDFETFSNSFYDALSYAIKSADDSGEYFIDSNFLVANIDEDNADFDAAIINLVGTYVNGNGSIDIEITEDGIYLKISYIEQYYESQLLSKIDMATLVPIFETGSYLKITQDGENAYLLKIYPCDIDFDTGTTIYRFELYEYDFINSDDDIAVVFSDSFAKQPDE